MIVRKPNASLGKMREIGATLTLPPSEAWGAAVPFMKMTSPVTLPSASVSVASEASPASWNSRVTASTCWPSIFRRLLPWLLPIFRH